MESVGCGGAGCFFNAKCKRDFERELLESPLSVAHPLASILDAARNWSVGFEDFRAR